MNNLWYPKQSPIITLVGMSGGATSLGISRGGPPIRGADGGDGYGYSIDEGAGDTESNAITSSSSTYHMSTWSFADSGSGSQGTLTDYGTTDITVDCGSQAGHWPFYLAVKVSDANKGRPSAWLGKKHSPETIQKLRELGTGRGHTLETKEKISMGL